ncbi:MAG: phytanoyl-CoA dioxygenase [Symploca sp. SIO3E6]|nr:phytanoyl-CoA dioxygenase [Caldora sp. SIO3E6]
MAMKLTNDQLNFYNENGYLLLPNYFTPVEVEVMRSEAAVLRLRELPGRSFNVDQVVRIIHGAHFESRVFQGLAHHPKLVEPATQLVGGSSVYIHRCSINFKGAFEETMWFWHQDSTYLCFQDGMPRDNQISIALTFLHKVTEFNGPIMIIPGSHRRALKQTAARGEVAVLHQGKYPSKGHLAYTTSPEIVTELANEHGIVSMKGSAGSVLFLHPTCIHGSGSNAISPFNRTIATVVYNSVENIPKPGENPRPEYIASRDYRPIEPLAEDILLSYSATERGAE